jgi:hypothetical protein
MLIFRMGLHVALIENSDIISSTFIVAGKLVTVQAIQA